MAVISPGTVRRLGLAESLLTRATMQSLLNLLPLSVGRPQVSFIGRAVALFSAFLLPLCFLPSALTATSAYTVSLLIFAVPCLVIARSLSASGAMARVQGPILKTWAVLVPMGVLLNLFFADDFFVYPNRSAVSGWAVPALDLTGIDWAHPIPLEEFAFYGLGFLAMLLGYVWVDENDAERSHGGGGKLAWRDGVLVPLGLALAGVASSDERVPAYWVYLVAVPLPVTLLVWPAVRERLNGWALAITLAVLVPASFVWEALLAVPRGWWGYQHDVMIGANAFGLPIEAVAVWVLAPITTAALFEFMRRPQRVAQ